MTPESIQHLEGLITQVWATAHDPKLLVCLVPKTELQNGSSEKVVNLLRRVAAQPEQSLVLVTADAVLFGFANRLSPDRSNPAVEVPT